MTWKKIQPPAGTPKGATVGAGGVEYSQDADGFYRVPGDVAAALVHHGYRVVGESEDMSLPKAAPILDVARMTREAMLDFCKENGVKLPSGRVKDSTLRALVINFVAGDPSVEVDEEAAEESAEEDQEQDNGDDSDDGSHKRSRRSKSAD